MSTASVRTVLPGLGYAAVLRAYSSSCELRVAAREVDERWTELHWIHGNLTATTVVVEHQPALCVSFIDAHGVGLGDPGWDLATAADMILGWRRAGAQRRGRWWII